MGKRVGHPEHQKVGRGILPGNVNKQARPGQRGSSRSGVHTQQPGTGKLVKEVVGGKLHRRGGEDPFPT
jgi:hypothetical protein